MKNKRLIAYISTILFLCLSGTVEARVLTVNFDVRLSTNYNQIIPVSMSLDIDSPTITEGDRGITGLFGKPRIESPLASIWGTPSDYSDWGVYDKAPSTQYSSSSVFSKTAISTTYTPKPYYLSSEFYDIQVIKKDDQVKENTASFKLINEFLDYDRNMDGDELIRYLELARDATFNAPFEARFFSSEYTSYIYNGYNYGWPDHSKPINSRSLGGEARISRISVSEVPLPPAIFMFVSGLIGLGLRKPGTHWGRKLERATRNPADFLR